MSSDSPELEALFDSIASAVAPAPEKVPEKATAEKIGRAHV